MSGGNRGIGREVAYGLAARGFTTVLGSRDPARGEEAARSLAERGVEVLAWQLDVADDENVARLAERVERELGAVHVLMNNAAILYDTWQAAATADLAVVREALETNLLGAWRLAEALVPLMRRSAGSRRVVNVSSGAGSLATMGGGTPAYSVSKAGLNALTRMLAAELRSDGILVNAVCPGWVATDMGGAGGRTIEEGAASVLWAVDLPDDGPSGGFFRDGKPVPW